MSNRSTNKKAPGGMRWCARCTEFKPAFTGSYCKECAKEYQQEYRNRLKEQGFNSYQEEFDRLRRRALQEYSFCRICGEDDIEVLKFVDTVDSGKGQMISLKNARKAGWPHNGRFSYICYNCEAKLKSLDKS
jgi:hypothetical protein